MCPRSSPACRRAPALRLERGLTRHRATSTPHPRLSCPHGRRPPMPAYQYVYVMKGLGKSYPGGREVLRDVWLSFLPGAKIGVLGLNGAGKSTLLRIMAGAVEPEHADLRTRQERQPDVAQHLASAGIAFPETLHDVDVLVSGHWRTSPMRTRQTRVRGRGRAVTRQASFEPQSGRAPAGRR